MFPGLASWVRGLMGPVDNVLIVEGRRRPLISDHCARCIDLTPRFPPLFFPARPVSHPSASLALSDSPVLRKPSLGVRSNGMLAMSSMVSVPCVCVRATNIHMYE